MSNGAKFQWNELVTKDPQSARRFYTSLLGWDARDIEMGDAGSYVMLLADGQEAGGIATSDEGGAHWLPYIRVPDVDESVAKVKTIGGKVLAGPMDAPGVGRFAVAVDSVGARFALLTPAS